MVGKMLDKIQHRGPDGRGLLAGSQFVFGHQRLAIIDLEGGKQPMETEDGRYVIVFNGEIYNYLELRQDLIRSGERFQTFSDTEVLLRLFAREGFQSLEKLNGMFAFAAFDRRERRLLAARDHFGIKPFYYQLSASGAFVFASEIKALFCCENLRPRVKEQSVHQYLTFQFCLRGETMFEDVCKLEPGCALEWKVGQSSPTITRYWDLNFEIDTHHTDGYFTDRLLALLSDSTRLQLRSDVPVGAYLSGGLDSSVVSTLATSHAATGLSVFSGRFTESPNYDESAYARALAESIGATYFDIVPTAREFTESIKDLIYHMDEPMAGPGLFPQFVVSREASNHVKVVLGGQGGDEIFGGYVRYLVGYLEQALKGAIYGTQEEGKHVVTFSSIVPNLSILRSYQPLLQGFWKDGLFSPMDERYFRLIDRSPDLKDLVTLEVWTQRNPARIFEEFQQVFNHPKTLSYFNKMTHFDLKTLLPALLQVEDRVSMAVSLESRVPLLDRRIVDLVTVMPPQMKFRRGELKYIFKQAVKNIIPQVILHRTNKMGFPVPFKEWMTGGIVREFVLDTLLSQRARGRGLFRTERIEEAIAQERPFGRQIWGVLCLELWHQVFIDGDGLS
ncbi:MAG: asparagine synthase (glutamine-hydrolyzing) [Acidobacteria bacterium]|nr:asparagine synthase (glutamine-hydrolyzing) [Acidobacteriota bacterium]MCI0723632.1 asparagine synthase (glutamine-hydrolyzing) [Acidobacteriota bacterium]